MKKGVWLLALLLAMNFVSVAQTIPFPTGNRDFNAISPWGYTNDGTSWDTSPFLPFIYKDMWYRLLPPNAITYTVATNTFNYSSPGTKYPLILFFQGAGEVGSDNNRQLINGGQVHRDAVLNGTFPGFCLFPQSVDYVKAVDLINKIIATQPVDINRIYVHGLSNGAVWSWNFALQNPTLVAAMAPMSGVVTGSPDPKMLYTPIRLAQGGLDTDPAPSWTQTIVDWYNTNGGHLEYYYFPTLGHGTWTTMYALPDFFSWFLSHAKNQIEVLYNRNLICPESPISVTMGFTAGFDAYQWMKDGVPLSNTTSNITVTSYGSYTGRIMNRGTWSDWATPVTVGVKTTTNTPPIQVNGLKSIVLPAPDGSTTTELTLPTGYQSYQWKNSSNAVVSTTQVFTKVPVGTFTASANEFNGCATIPSPVFNVVSASAPNGPDAVDDFLGYATSSTQVTLGWADKPAPLYNETGFEIYRATASAGPYTLIAITQPDIIGYTDTNLVPNTSYFYQVRPVNQFSAAPVSPIVSVLTQVDNVAPTAPSNLIATGTTTTSISLSWTASTDNVGVFRYDVFKDGVKVISTSSTTATVFNLTANQSYNFIVKARDMAGNSSAPSNDLFKAATASGLNYQYYEPATTPSVLPDFTTLSPIVKSGNTPNIDLSVRNRDTNIDLYWSGTINIPVAGAYTFGTSSDDGSRLYIGGYGTSFLVVDNDGAHGITAKEGTKTFAAPGVYPIVVTFFQGGGGYGLTIYWKNTASGVVAQTTIPNSAFIPTTTPAGSAPVAPSGLAAVATNFNQINLSWVDNSTNETGFQIYRATSNAGPFISIASVAANATTYQDLGLTGSTTYYYRVTANGLYGESALSNQVPRGLSYSYYEAVAMTSLTQIATMSPNKTGSSAFFDITVRDRSDNMAIDWKGKINITTAATYTFFASSDDGSLLSIDGALVVSNDTDGAQKEKSGTKALTVGWHDIDVQWRKHTSTSSRLTVSYSRPGMSKTSITVSNSTPLFFGTEINAKTLAAPAAPLVPTNVAVTLPQPTSILLSWTDNATNETSYQIMRSYKQNTNYVIFKTLSPNTTSFLDAGLFTNATYYYKVQAVGDGGTSTSVEVSGTTANNPPTITQLNNTAIKYGILSSINVTAVDPDNDPMTLTVTGLPSFATFADHTDGTGNMQLSPTSAQLGQYPISVTAHDNHNGTSTTSFVLTVTDKVAPVITAFANPNINEGQPAVLLIQASSDFGPSGIAWSFNNLPTFAVPSINGGLCTLNMTPGFTDSGPYTVDVLVTDALATTKQTFTITVAEVNPNSKVYVNLVSSTSASAPWNNMSALTLGSLKNDNNVTTTSGVSILAPTYTSYTQGAVTGNNSGVFPDNVIQDYYYFGFNNAPNTVAVQLSGLDVTKKYYFNFFGSSTFANMGDNGSTVYTIGATSVSLRVQNNTMNVAKISSVAPNPDGTITFNMSKAPGAPVGYLNAFTYEAVYQDGTVPATPRNVAAVVTAGNAKLTWVDAPFNEDGFNIYRSTSAGGPFTKVNNYPIAKNTIAWTDSTVYSGITYYYEASAYNVFGESPLSPASMLVMPTIAPKITVSGSVSVTANSFGMITVSTTPDATLSIGTVPGFAILNPSSASSTDIILLPTTTDAGSYPIIATAINGQGLITNQTITIVVPESVLYRVSVNFNSATAAPAPWNNTNKSPVGNDVFSNLKDDNSANTNITLTLQTAFGGVFAGGKTTGNNSGVVPDAVLSEYYYFGIFNAANDIYMLVSGLDPLNKYRFKFVASSTFTNNGTISDNGSTVFTIGSQSVAVAVQNNTTQLGIIQNVITNAQGQVTIHLSKGATATVGYINGMIIEALPVDPNSFAPSNLVASGYSATQVNLNWSDNSPVETGYEVYRSTSGADGSWGLITTTAPDVTSYIDVVSQQNTVFYYKVRAITATTPSAYSNVGQSGTVTSKILINLAGSATYDVAAPWNNTSRFGLTGDIFVGFRDQNGLNTGLRMRVVQQLETYNSWGPTTGKNSGVVPDKVLQSFWFNDAYFPIGIYVIDGLDQTYSYNLGFMGSISSQYSGTSVIQTDFAADNRVTVNRNDNNTSTISYIRNIRPDQNGEIQFTVKEHAGSIWAIWNMLAIEAFPNGGQLPSGGRVASSASTKSDNGNIKEIRYGLGSEELALYPNPVETKLQMDITDSSLGELNYSVYNTMGREVSHGTLNSDVINPQFVINVDLPASVYVMKIIYPNGKVETRRFVKN